MQANVSPTGEILTLPEVAQWLKVHQTTLYRLVHQGKLPAFRVGTEWRFSRVSIENWMRSAAEQAP